jgi:c-di-GMP-binding flagellar brake protein YcgR
MGLLEMLGLKKAPTAKQLRDMLPSLHSFIDVAIKNGPKGSICFENAGTKTFLTTSIPGMAAGQSVNFLYSNEHGRYRFTATITATDGKQATFAMPARIETVQKFAGAAKRKTVRIDTTVQMSWRYKPLGKIATEWQKASVSDISRSGCSLATPVQIKVGSVLELKLPLLANGGDMTLSAEAMRVDAMGTTKQRYSAGLKFVQTTAEGERAVIDFINRRQTDLRGRGLG